MKQTAEAKYKNAFRQERPAHGVHDDFSARHPKMQLSQRAKIFSPFAALRGFEEAIESKLERYVSRAELTEEDQARVNLLLNRLVELRADSRRARSEPPLVTVTFYVPCGDENHEAYGLYGKYETVSGRLRKIDPVLRKALQVDESVIEFADISDIQIDPRHEEGG